jgi:hypothetical protein
MEKKTVTRRHHGQKHWKRKNGDTALRREQCDMTAESRNGGAGADSIAENRLGNHVSTAKNIDKD